MTDQAEQEALDQAAKAGLFKMLPYLLRLKIEPTEDNPNPRAIEAESNPSQQ